MSGVRISASILAADFGCLRASVREAEEAGCEEVHFDVMDGQFVPNISFGLPVLEAVRRVTQLPIDVHMMVAAPERFAKAFAAAGADSFTIHVEACRDVPNAVAHIRELGMRPGIAINPETPVSAIADYVREVDRVLVMTVHPGFGGQSFMPQLTPKITETAAAGRSVGRVVEIAVDGGIKHTTARSAARAGATVLVSGTGIFDDPDGVHQGVAKIRASANGESERMA